MKKVSKFEDIEFDIKKGSLASIKMPTNEYADVYIISPGRKRAVVKFIDTEGYGSKEFRVLRSTLEPPLNPDINTRFRYFEDLTVMTIDAEIKSLIIAGEGGIGKSFTVENMLLREELREGEEYIMVKGHTTPKALFNLLKDNWDRLIVFDDCDSAFKDPISLNILKAVLDAFKKHRFVSWLTTSGGRSSSDGTFEFTGSCIFISNLDKEDFNQALLSRSVVVDLHMTIEEKIQRLEGIIDTIDTEMPLAEKREVLSLLDKYKFNVDDLNIRTLLKALSVYKKSKDIELARYEILNG